MHTDEGPSRLRARRFAMYRFLLTRRGVAIAAALLAVVLAPSSAFAARTVYFAGSTSPATTPMSLEMGKSKVSRIAVQYDTACFAYLTA